MKIFLRNLCLCADAALLPACAGAQVGGAVPSFPTSVAQGEHGRNLLYVANGGVSIYTYPRAKFVGMLGGFSGTVGLCADAAGDVFAPFIYGYGGTYEFAHGDQSPIAYLSYNYGYSDACAVNRPMGTLAVINGSPFNAPYVTVYRYKQHFGWRLGKSYELAGITTGAFCGYDDKSNLFCDGTTASSTFALNELPDGSKSFGQVAVAQSIAAPGGVQWDGRHLAIGDSGVSPTVIYQFDVSGSTARKVGSTTLGGSTMVLQFWIQGGTVVAPDAERSCSQSEEGCIAFYAYPAGGSARETIPLTGASGAVVSLASPLK